MKNSFDKVQLKSAALYKSPLQRNVPLIAVHESDAGGSAITSASCNSKDSKRFPFGWRRRGFPALWRVLSRGALRVQLLKLLRDH